MTSTTPYKPRHAAAWQDDACWPTPAAPLNTKHKRKRRRKARAVLRVLIPITIITAIWFMAIWLPQYRAELAERMRQLEWAAEEARHPFNYRDMVELAAAKEGLDPALVAAVILSESSFNPKAESSLGARGLMQLMPGTAQWVAGKLDEIYDPEALYDPQTNLRYGCWFLGYLTNRFSGDPVKITAGYHAGGGQVDAWLKNPEYTAGGELVVIPFKDTDWYVRKVMTAYEVYQRHYYAVPASASGEAGA